MKKYVASIIIALLFGCISYGQNNPLCGTGEYGAGEISSNLIHDICQDSMGFIWIATEYGLNKFDGITFKQYLHDERDTSSVSDNNIHKLLIDTENRLWICCINGLQVYDAEKDVFRHIRFPDHLKPHVTDLKEFPDAFWIATSGKGLFELKKNSCEAQPLKSLNGLVENRVISCIYEDIRRSIWIGTLNNQLHDEGLLQINPETGETAVFHLPGQLDKNINAIAEDGAGHLYIGTSNSVLLYDAVSGKFIPVLCKDHPRISVKSMISGSDGRVFVGTEGQGLKYIDLSQKQLVSAENAQFPFDFRKARVYALLEDRNRNLWLGCFQKGLFQIPHQTQPFDFWGFHDKVFPLEGAVTSICEDSQGAMWCSIANEGIFRLNEQGKVEKHFPQPQTTVCLFEDSDRQLWVSIYDKALLAKMDKKTGQCRFVPVPQSGYIKTMVEDRQKRLYLSTFGLGFIRYNLQTGAWEKIKMQNREPGRGDLKNFWINALLCDSRGLIWLGHYQGVSCYDPDRDRFIHTGYMDSLSTQITLSLLEDRAGKIWLGTYNGLFRIDTLTGDVKNYTMADGLSNNVICGLTEDEQGDIWCSTFQGINQLKVKEEKIISYRSGNGLTDRVYNRGVYFHDKNGKIYFGGNTGITSFFPGNIAVSDYDCDIVTTNLYIHNQPVSTRTASGGKPVTDTGINHAKTFRFAYEDNTFTFEFSTMDFHDPQNIHYEYRLKELSDSWDATLPGVNRITYTHLPPGNYTLEIKARKYGSLSSVKRLFLRISPPWYQSRSAYICYFLLLIAVGLQAAYVINKKQTETVNEAKLRFFINISHEIRSPMTLIISPLDRLLKRNCDADTRKTLERMQRNAQRILGLINQLLDIQKIDKGQMKLKFSETDLVGFIKELFEVFEEQATQRNIRFTFERHVEKLPVWIDRNNFDKVLMNVLSNAFKYTPDAGEISIFLTSGIDAGNWGTLHNYAEICIIDTGTGIDEDKIKKIFNRFYQAHNELTFGNTGSGIGLNLSHTLIKLHQGSLTASNRNDVKGSCFTIRIPLGKDHIRKEYLAENEPDARLVVRQELPARQDAYKKKFVKRKTNYKILVADDEEEIRDFIRQELGETYKIITATNGKDAWQTTLSQLPDLIILDVMMPEIDGFTFVKKLKTNSHASHIPVILLTSKAKHDDRLHGLDKGADAYLTKPFNIDELFATVNNLINNRRMLKGKFSGTQDQQDKVKSIDFKSSDELLMERIMTIINDNMANPDLNVRMLVSKVGLSHVQLHRKLKEMTGIPASDFIRNIRLKQAAELLKEKKMNITQIAYAVGFANQTHFSTAFKKFYGISPTEYISQMK
jgi:signal transduction histidine kinase/ligand-binding sensor domain-containing protein/CheY-like chemotaxis protein/AraC-like DNA-binding protein